MPNVQMIIKLIWIQFRFVTLNSHLQELLLLFKSVSKIRKLGIKRVSISLLFKYCVAYDS